MPAFKFTLNGKAQRIETEADRLLLEVLREDLGLIGVRYGCGEGQCRACTVLLDGKPVPSCVTPVRLAEGKSVLTVEGLAVNGKLHPVQQAFLEEGALQCGYCTSGMMLTAVALLKTTPHPTEQQVAEGMNNNLCRCCCYPSIVTAVRLAAKLSALNTQGAGHAG